VQEWLGRMSGEEVTDGLERGRVED
jgi:hypothetical protein